jgi:hypothetical protein
MEPAHKDYGEVVLTTYVVLLVAGSLAGLVVVLFLWG